jgi:hypothetical protein
MIDGQHRICAWGDDAGRSIDTFIRERSHVHVQYVVQENKTRRLAQIISATLVITGSVILVYAPETNRLLADLVGIALIVAAAGSAGFRRLWIKSKGIDLAAGDDVPTGRSTKPTVMCSRKEQS